MQMMQTAIFAAKAAGNFSKNYFQKTQQLFYKEQEEVFTQTDVQTEALIKDVIRKEFPKHNILGEETGLTKESKSDYTWIIDPIDGSENFTRGIYLYGISIALAIKNEVKIATVFNPLTNELFSAEKGKGAFLNGKPISVSQRSELSKAVIYGTELYKSKEYLKPLFDKVKNLRITSSSAYETCLVACGRIEGFVKVTTHPWGFAAANLIVEEAGGQVTNFDGSTWDTRSNKILSSNKVLHQELLDLINQK